MSRDIDATLAAALANGSIMPVILAALTFKAGVSYAWSGVGDLSWNGNVFKGVGSLGGVSPITEETKVQADGTSVKLSGLSLAAFVNAAAPAGMTPPVTVPTGSFVAWAKPTTVTQAASAEASAAATLTGATISMDGGGIIGGWGASATWSGFECALPADAVITAIYPVLLASDQGTTPTGLRSPSWLPAPAFEGQCNGSSIGSSLAVLEAATLGVSIAGDEEPVHQTIMISGLGLAVYYTSATNAFPVLGELLDDIQMGAPADIWFGLMADGALLGTPYLVFAGTIDQPTINISAQTVDCSLALENRLSDLQRANQRRYTAADQHIAYPDDTAFNWVEILNDIALRWGS